MAWSGSFKTTACKNLSLLISLSEQSQSIENNTTTIAWKISGYRTDGATGYITCGGFKLVINGTTVYSKSEDYRIDVYNGTVVASGTTTISHNSDGTKSFSASAEAGIYYHDVNCSGSGSFTLPTIPRKSTLSVGNGTLGTAQTLTITRKSSSFKHTITAKCGSSTVTVCTKSSSTSISFTPPLSWASQNTTGTSVSVTYTLITYNGNSEVGRDTPSAKTCSIPASVKPSCSITVSDAMGYSGTYGGYLKGLSKLKVTINVDTSSAGGATIKYYKTSANGSTYTSSSFTTDVLAKSGTLTISTTITDTRGRTATASATVTVLDYVVPLITALSVHRCDSNGTQNDINGNYVKVVFSSSVTSLSSKNTASYKLEYKKTTDTTYTSVSLTSYNNNYAVSNASYIFAANSGSSYNVRVIVTDKFTTGSKTTSASTGFTIMHWLASGLGMAIGKISELANVLDIGFQTRFMGGILHPVLEPATDLNDVRTPNTYVGADISSNKYLNCPLTSGTFTLEVVGMGEAGQVKQRLTYCHKTLAKAWERIYYASSWGEWVCVSDFDGQLLWNSASWMVSSQSATLAEPISKQKNGIVLVFSKYSGGAVDESFSTHFVPKKVVSLHEGKGFNFNLTGMWANGMKYLYIYDTQIVGHDNNNVENFVTGGITYNNKYYVLRYVIGV